MNYMRRTDEYDMLVTEMWRNDERNASVSKHLTKGKVLRTPEGKPIIYVASPENSGLVKATRIGRPSWY